MVFLVYPQHLSEPELNIVFKILKVMKKHFTYYLTLLLAGTLLCDCSSTSNAKRSGGNLSLERLTRDESVVIGTVEFRGNVKAVNMYNINRKLVKSINFNHVQLKTNLNVIVKPGRYYLMVIYSDDCGMKEKFSFSTETDNQGQVTSEKGWSSPSDEFLKFDVPGSSLVNLGAFIVRIDSKSERDPFYGSLTSCRFTLYHEESDVAEKFRSQNSEIYEHFKDKIVTVNKKTGQ